MRRLFWLTLDRLGHAIPWIRFGVVRYAICRRARPHLFDDPPGYDWADDDTLTRTDFEERFSRLEPVELVGSPKVVITSTWPVTTGPQTWGAGTTTTFTWTGKGWS